jgi:tetratricopeptide (TPR) repeat protein
MTDLDAAKPLANAPASWSVAAEISADDLDPPQRFPRWVLAAALLLLGAACAAVAMQMRTPKVAVVPPVEVPVVIPPTVEAPVVEAPVVVPAAVVVERISEDDLNMKELPARRKARGLANRGKAKLELGNDEQARSLLERAAALDPTLPEAWRDLAVARLRLSDNNGARSASEKYARLAPGPEAQALLRLVE